MICKEGKDCEWWTSDVCYWSYCFDIYIYIGKRFGYDQTSSNFLIYSSSYQFPNASKTLQRRWSYQTLLPLLLIHQTQKKGVLRRLTNSNRFDWYRSLAIIFFGINDYGALSSGPGTMSEAADQLISQTEYLITTGKFKNFIIIS